MRERKQLVAAWQQQLEDGAVNIALLCRTYGVSRETGYKWLRRFEEGGLDALADRSRRPHTSPDATPEKVVDLIVKVRKARPFWGPVTLREVLVRQGVPAEDLPSSTPRAAPSNTAVVVPTYLPGWDVQRAGSDGSIVLDRRKIALNSALRGELVALRSAGATRVEVYFGPVVLGYIERFRRPLRLARPRRKQKTMWCVPRWTPST